MSKSFGYEIKREFRKPVADLFAAMLDGDVLKELWGLKKITFTSENPKEAYAEMTIGDENWNFELLYDSIIKDKHLSWKVRFDRAPEKEILVSILFSGGSDSGKLVVSQSNFDSKEESDANEKAWKASLTKLEGILEK